MSVVLVPQVQTPEQLSSVLIELREYLNKVHDHAVRSKITGAKSEAMPTLSPAAKKLLEANTAAGISQASIKTLLAELEETRITAPRMRIMLPAWPDSSIREKLITHVRTHIHPLVMLSFAVRADIGGGFILQAGSRRFDFSFHEQLLTNKHKISELLNKYAKA